MSSKENPMANLTKVDQMDKEFKNLSKTIKESKDKASKLLGSVREKKNQLIEEKRRIAEESAKESVVETNDVDVAMPSVDENVESKESTDQQSPTVEVSEPVKSETVEVVTESKSEVKEETPVVEERTALKSEDRKVAQETESSEKVEKVKNSKKEEPKSVSAKKSDKNAVSPDVPKEIINKHRAQNVVEPRIFVPPQPEKRQPRQNNDYKNTQGKPRQQTGAFGKDKQPNANASSFKSPQITAGTTFIPKPSQKDRRNQGKKYDSKSYDDKKNINNKRTLIREAQMEGELSDDEVARRFKLRKGNKSTQDSQVIKITNAVIETDPVAIKTLSEKIGHTAIEIVKVLLQNGIFKTVNDSIDFSTAELVAMTFDITLELKVAQTSEDKFTDLYNVEDDPSQLVKRAPIVTIMGHVDHGKTSLLDYIRKASVAAGEAGGITQHIGAYTIRLRGEKITFIDTPGHEAFTTMRARGAMVTDIAIIVVAADDSIKPQTVEAINHAKAAKVPIIVAINKIDKSSANVEKVLNDLTKYDLLCEEYGGDTICVPVSAKTGEGVDNLLDQILLVAELYDLKANPKAKAKGTILEARMDNVVGAVATVLVQNGTLRVGDTVVAGSCTGKVKSMHDDKNVLVKAAGPSIPVAVLGFESVPNAGDPMIVCDEKLAKEIANERKIKERSMRLNKTSSLEEIMLQMSAGKLKELNLIIKCDVQGSVEALSQELLKQSNEEVQVKVVHSGVGAVNESDVTLASTCGAIIIAFNVRADANAKNAAQNNQIQIRSYNVIYEAIEDIQAALKGMLAPKFRENIIGKATVRSTFKISGVGTIAGCYVTEGKLDKTAQVRLYRNDIAIYTGNVMSLKRMKDDVKEVQQGYECGLGIEKFNDIKEGDEIDCFVMEKYN